MIEASNLGDQLGGVCSASCDVGSFFRKPLFCQRL